ncbi:DUF4150 domain-containing protein [Myxococcus sp. CA056]|uniref:DUF4150 domain-containing protein n=1 Tax=Myxococcus sp. CA056 TaxID=2741740 RepID=UPI0020C703C8|nr:PAAR-like domain-containing protein [Myxococcus sp. CA056]
MGRVYANGRSILHKGDGNTHTSAAPDVCKVPTPGGPVPTPFVNSAQDSMLTKGSTSVTIEGHPVALTSSELSTSSGDEPGTAGGLISSKFKGKMAWGSGSMDVKVEGKGVVRYLDVTLHNGNTYNTTFISDGRTAWAYGDDSQCTACGKSTESHRVHEMNDVVVHMDTVFLKLMELLHEQRPLIERHLQLQKKKEEVTARAQADMDALDDQVQIFVDKLKAKVIQLKSKSPPPREEAKADIIRLQSSLEHERQHASTQKAQKALERDGLIATLLEEMRQLNATLESMKPVLRKHGDNGTYNEGYMVGICISRCAKKLLVTCSGSEGATPGFLEATKATPFSYVRGFQASAQQVKALQKLKRTSNTWMCAAPQLIQEGRKGGHNIRTMTERYFTPMREVTTMPIPISWTDEAGAREEQKRYGHGETVPSCTSCQQLLPEMLCNNSKDCA